jgi:hypothetical protein
MKKAFALLVVLACAAPSLLVAQPNVDPSKILAAFSSTIRTAGGEFMITVLQDRTIDPLFGTSPSRFAIRARARMATILFIQGVASKEFEFKPDVTVVQKGETLEGKASSIKNFTAGKVAKGASVQGLVELPKKLNLYDPFKVMMGGQTAEFNISADDVTDYGNKDPK